MEKQVVRIEGKELRAGTWAMSIGYKVEHRALKRLIRKYQSEFEELGIVATPLPQISGKKGRKLEEFLLNESQSMYLGTLLTNNAQVRSFKLHLVKEFTRMKAELIRISSQNQNAEWLETRKLGKETRVIATDTIKNFVDYAKDQGSTKAAMYYITISKMENQALFLLEQKYKNLRDVLNLHQLSTIKSADMIVMKALIDGMEQGRHYTDIYKLAKLRVESFAEIIGKTLIPEAQLKLK